MPAPLQASTADQELADIEMLLELLTSTLQQLLELQ